MRRLEVRRLSVDGGPRDRLALELRCPVRSWGSPILMLFLLGDCTAGMVSSTSLNEVGAPGTTPWRILQTEEQS